MRDWMESSKEEHWKRTDFDTDGDGSLGATGVYEVTDGVVFYDTEEPLAWIQTDSAVELSEIS